MSAWLPGLLGSLRARLSQHIIFWVFLSLVLIEALILVPSYYMRQRQLFQQLEDVSAATIFSVIRLSQPDIDEIKILKNAKKVIVNSAIVGLTIYEADGRLIGTVGELPQMNFSNVKTDQQDNSRRQDGNYYDIAWSANQLGLKYTLITRVDARSVNQELSAYVGRIAGLILLISAVVTSSTILVLGVIVILPILRLRDDLITVGEAIAKEQDTNNLYSLNIKRDDELGEVLEAFQQMYQRVYQEIKERKSAEEVLREEQEKSEKLLLNILPHSIAMRLKNQQSLIAERFDEVTILFADLVNFTSLASILSPTELVNLLNEIFSVFDRIASLDGLEKIKTIGDAYMVVGGLPNMRTDHAEAIAEMALNMQNQIQRFQSNGGEPLSIRIGINTGSVVAGVIGLTKFTYDLWGDTVNIASRMESQGLPGYIQVTEATYELLKDKYIFEKRGLLLVKGRGEMITYWLLGRKEK